MDAALHNDIVGVRDMGVFRGIFLSSNPQNVSVHGIKAKICSKSIENPPETPKALEFFLVTSLVLGVYCGTCIYIAEHLFLVCTCAGVQLDFNKCAGKKFPS